MSSKSTRRRPPAPARTSGRPPAVSRWWVIGGVGLVLAVAVVLAAAMSGDDDEPASAKHEIGTVEVTGTPLPSYDGEEPADDPAVGERAPTLSGEGFDAQPVTIGPTGNPQVVVFLAHWCPHCQAEVPRIVELADDGAFEGIDVSAVATGTRSDQDNYPPSAWLEREQWPFDVMVDDEQGSAGQAFGLTSYPYFVFLDGDGDVLGRAAGEVLPAQLRDVLDAMRDGEPLPSASGSSSGAG